MGVTNAEHLQESNMTEAILFIVGLIFKGWNSRSENQASDKCE
jgi:hypothetical protein